VDGGGKRRHTPWWTEEVKEAIKRKTKNMRIWLRRRTPETREEYVIARNEAKRVKRRAEKDSWRELGERLEEDQRGNKSLLYGLARSYRRDKRKLNNIKDVNGEVRVTAEEINERWTEYFEALLNVEGENRELEAEDGQGGQGGEEENEFTEQEFEEALARMKNGKAPGEDGVGIELVREAGTQVKKYILKVLNKCWRSGRVPEE
jgi:hypothetical protein